MLGFVASLACCMLAAALAEPAIVSYVDSAGINWGAQPPTPIVNAGPTKYTHVYCGFYLPSLNESTDFLEVVTNPNPAYGGQFFVQAMHNASKKVVIGVGGSTEIPFSPAYFTNNEPVALGTKLAAMVRQAGVDGVGIDYEDDWTNGNPGLTGYGSTRSPGGGPAVPWLITLTKTLRQLLPREQGYIITHAPQAPYFDLGYVDVYKAIADDLDWFNVQFYNQGQGTYDTYQTLVVQEQIKVPASCVPVWDGSLTDIIVNKGIPQEKISIGKIVGPADGQSGYIAPNDLAQIITQARKLFPNLAGCMGWQWGSDTNGSWAQLMYDAFHSSAENATVTASHKGRKH